MSKYKYCPKGCKVHIKRLTYDATKNKEKKPRTIIKYCPNCDSFFNKEDLEIVFIVLDEGDFIDMDSEVH